MGNNKLNLYVCLDLSSNKIKKIEGLDNLRKLEMLLLAKNKISVIENMDTLEELTIFNIGHNCIEHRDNVMIFSPDKIPVYTIKCPLFHNIGGFCNRM